MDLEYMIGLTSIIHNHLVMLGGDEEDRREMAASLDLEDWGPEDHQDAILDALDEIRSAIGEQG